MGEIDSLVAAMDRPFVLMGGWNMTLGEIGPRWLGHLPAMGVGYPGDRPSGGRPIGCMMISGDLQ
eukprot:7373006-Pyramimonas_sp.AAC.1